MTLALEEKSVTEERTSYNLADWQGYLSYAEIDLIKDITVKLPPDPDVLCIGAGAGTCTLAVLEERDDVLYYSVDILTDEHETTTNEHLRLEETRWARTGHVIRIWGNSHIVGKRWRIPLDMLIIDGDHSESGISEDLMRWLPRVKEGGYVLIHDYGSDNWPAVKDVVDRVPKTVWQHINTSDSMIAFRKQASQEGS
jgi:hypothetical protein